MTTKTITINIISIISIITVTIITIVITTIITMMGSDSLRGGLQEAEPVGEDRGGEYQDEDEEDVPGLGP